MLFEDLNVFSGFSLGEFYTYGRHTALLYIGKGKTHKSRLENSAFVKYYRKVSNTRNKVDILFRDRLSLPLIDTNSCFEVLAWHTPQLQSHLSR